MKILVAENAGFCWGVQRALDLVGGAVTDPTPIASMGPLIHNPQVVEDLQRRGVRQVEGLDDLAPGERVVVRAHGITPQVREELRRRELDVVDGTCPHVGRSQGLVRRYLQRGYEIVILGDAAHAEVIGLVGYAEGRGHVVAGVEDVARLPADLDRVAVLAQSTETRERFNKVAEAACERFREVAQVDTLCDVTDKRQREIPALAQDVQALIVVGGRNSANTRHLADLGRATGKPTYPIEVPDELDPKVMVQYSSVGVTAGASTPGEMIERVVDRLREIGEGR